MNLSALLHPLKFTHIFLLLYAATLLSGAATTRVALVSDLHVALGSNETARLHESRLSAVIKAVNAADVDLVLVEGDLTENGTRTELAAFERKIRGFDSPVWFVAGNHDLGNKRIPGRAPGRTEITFGKLRNYEIEMGKSYWVREAAGVRVIGLNSALYGSKLPREQGMWRLLESELEKTNSLPTIILQHHPLFLKDLSEGGGDYFNMEPYPRRRLLGLAQQGGVKAILSGHVHREITSSTGGVLLYTTPPVAFGLPKGRQAEGWTLITVSRTEARAQFRPLQAR